MLRKSVLALPAVALVAVAVALMGSSLAGSSQLPAQARSLTDPPKAAPTAEAGSTVVVTRDWQEVAASPIRR
jgi:hypothetical protein